MNACMLNDSQALPHFIRHITHKYFMPTSHLKLSSRNSHFPEAILKKEGLELAAWSSDLEGLIPLFHNC